MDEMLPLLEEKNGRIHVLGQVRRSQAHGRNPLFHATAVIAAITPDGKMIFADKTEKQKAKGCPVPDGIHVLDIFGGHMSYSDLTENDFKNGLSQKTFKKCAARELSEELLIEKKDGSLEPLPVDLEKLIPVGFYCMENDHNREYSWAYLYPIMKDENYVSQDTLIQDGKEILISQPLVYLDSQEAIALYLSDSLTQWEFDDAFGRIIDKDQGVALLKILFEATCKE